MDAFDWSDAATEAAQLVAQANLTLDEIADKVGVARSTIWRWRKHPEFTGKIDEHLARFREEVRRRGVAFLEKRVAAVNDRWNRMQRLMEARADQYRDIPGGNTGLIIRTVKQVGSGENARVIEEYVLDAALLKEIREHEKQAAIELGQWENRLNIGTVKAGDDDVSKALEQLNEDDESAASEIRGEDWATPEPGREDGPCPSRDET